MLKYPFINQQKGDNMTIKGINFRSLALAGFVAGYVMYFVDKWFQGFLGLFGVFPGTSNAWWMLEHHIDGIVFALIFAWPALYNRFPGAKWVKGFIFGFLWWIAFLIVAFITGALGAQTFQQMPVTAGVVISMLILHLIYGIVLGILYSPGNQISAKEGSEIPVR